MHTVISLTVSRWFDVYCSGLLEGIQIVDVYNKGRKY